MDYLDNPPTRREGGQNSTPIQAVRGVNFGSRLTLQAAFCDTLIRMSPEGHKVWKGISFVFQMQMNNYLHGCLNLIGAVECGWMLQQVSQAVCAGTASVPEALAWIDSQRFSSASGAYGDGWIEQRWNMLKDALGLAPVG